jgi:hypothetical protein
MMILSRQGLSSLAELLGTLSWDSAGLLIYKHLALRLEDIRNGAVRAIAGQLEELGWWLGSRTTLAQRAREGYRPAGRRR